MHVGFIGLGNVGSKLAGCVIRNGLQLTVLDLDRTAAEPLLAQGAVFGESPKQMATDCDVIVTCLPSPAASAAVLENEDGVLAGLTQDTVWAEMSTTDEAEVLRLGEKVVAAGGHAVDCPVSGGCHRAATGNIHYGFSAKRHWFVSTNSRTKRCSIRNQPAIDKNHE